MKNVMTPAMWQLGGSIAATQILLTFIFSRLPFPWSKKPGFLAHQCIAFPVVCYAAWLGCGEWASIAGTVLTAEERVYGENPVGRYLSQFMFAQLLCWDIPTGLIVPSMREGVMIVHHVLMMGMAYLGLSMLGYYGVYFLGVVELSSIPLQIMNIFKPESVNELTKIHPLFNLLNEVSRILFAIAFILVRAVHFPYISFAYVLPDVFQMLQKPSMSTADRYTLHAIWFSNLTLTLLQLYWATLIFKGLQKLLFPKQEKAKK